MQHFLSILIVFHIIRNNIKPQGRLHNSGARFYILASFLTLSTQITMPIRLEKLLYFCIMLIVFLFEIQCTLEYCANSAH